MTKVFSDLAINKFIYIFIIGFLCIFNVGLVKVDRILAIDENKGLTLSPVRGEIETSPGFSFEGSLKVSNSTDKEMPIVLSSSAFNVINPQYDYEFDDKSDIAKWVSFEIANFNLSPGETKSVKYNLNVPLLAEPGGRYISLFATSDVDNTTSESTVNSRQRVASLLYITVNGDITRSGSLISLNSPWFMSGDTSFWSAVVRNSGSTHFRSCYSIKLSNIFDGTTVASSSGSALVLPATIRSIKDNIPNPTFPGVYRLNYEIGMGDSPAAKKSQIVIYFPSLLFMILIPISALIVLWKFNRTR